MLEKIVAQIALVLLGWVEKRISLSKTAIDADQDIERLQRAGSRVDEWLREQQNDLHTRSQSNEAGTELGSEGVHSTTGGVGTEQQSDKST
jgi:hypothetical protein